MDIDLFGVWEDALLVDMGLSKGDQNGTKYAVHPWHLYSVPEEPAICPSLAFGKYDLNGGCKVFDGASQYERFYTIMMHIVRSDELIDTFVSLGFKAEYFDTHSIHKVAVTHVPVVSQTLCPLLPFASVPIVRCMEL